MISPARFSPSRTVVFVGRRRLPLRAARRLGLAVVCVDEGTAGKRQAQGIALLLKRSFTPGQSDWAEVAGRLQSIDLPIAAVFALTERSVVPAAEIARRLGLPGNGVETAVRTTDKLAMKRAIEDAGLRHAHYADAEDGLDADELIDELGLPLVIKGRISSGGRQNLILRERRELPRRLRAGWMAESFIEGVEMSVESFLQGGQIVFTNLTEYFRVRWANILPAPLDPATHKNVLDLNKKALEALGIEEGFTHLELFLTPEGPVFGEIAARPPGGHITEMMALAYGFDPWEAWLRLGLGEAVDFPATAVRSAGVWVLHPGAGIVRTIAGIGAARALPGVEKIELRLRPGQRVAERVGAGQESGYLLVTGRDREEVAERLLAAHRAIRIEMEV